MCIRDRLITELSTTGVESYTPYPILFVHGLGADSTTWDTTMKILEQFFQQYENYAPQYPYLEAYSMDDNLGSVDELKQRRQNASI